MRTTAASAVFADRVPTEDAVVVRKLRDAGAVCIGKLNMHEFAYGGTSVISHFGPVRIRGTPTIRRAVPRAGRQLPLRLVCAPPRSVPTRPHPSGCPLRCAVWLASRPHTDSPDHAKYVADATRRTLYQPVTLQRILNGSTIPLPVYVEAQHRMAILRNRAPEIFARVDVLVTPTTMRMPRC